MAIKLIIIGYLTYKKMRNKRKYALIKDMIYNNGRIFWEIFPKSGKACVFFIRREVQLYHSIYKIIWL
jgi:hypothetical protein